MPAPAEKNPEKSSSKKSSLYSSKKSSREDWKRLCKRLQENQELEGKDEPVYVEHQRRRIKGKYIRCGLLLAGVCGVSAFLIVGLPSIWEGIGKSAHAARAVWLPVSGLSFLLVLVMMLSMGAYQDEFGQGKYHIKCGLFSRRTIV